jgi:ribosomal protein S12 methylthiotransferase
MNADNPIRVALVSLGCPKNLVDSEVMLGQLAADGLIVAAPMDQADVAVINTCGFLAAARDESLEIINEALEFKAAGQLRRVVVAGCLPSRDGETLYQLAPGIDALVGVNDRDQLVQAVLGQKHTTLLTPHSPRPRPCAADTGRFRLTPPHTAYLRISEGCAQNCTYCTIPQIRGPLRSKSPQAVIEEARELIADGAVELNVIAQDTTAYGSDRDDGANLPDLLAQLDGLDGLRWLRLLYTYPRRFTDRLIDTLAACERVVPYVDIPLQHIADGVLKRMGRGVSGRQTRDLLAKLRERVPDIAIRTTFIVGFPGESDEDFAQLLEFVREFRFEAMGAFEYSPEEGTPAAEMPDQVSDDVKAERAEALMLAQQQIVFENNERMTGRELEVLVDGSDPDETLVGRHAGQAPDIDSVCIIQPRRGRRVEPGTFATLAVAGYDGYDLVVE